jgi:cytochrome oxidase assembly protein ShyY1
VNARYQVEALFWRVAPPVAAVLLTILFVSLGFWQLDRAAEKASLQRLFDADAGYTPLSDEMSVVDYQRISASGRFLGDRHFLIDNMILNSRLGYFVITPFEYASDKPLLMVNRGWVAAGTDRSLPTLMPLPAADTEVPSGTCRGSEFAAATPFPRAPAGRNWLPIRSCRIFHRRSAASCFLSFCCSIRTMRMHSSASGNRRAVDRQCTTDTPFNGLRWRQRSSAY